MFISFCADDYINNEVKVNTCLSKEKQKQVIKHCEYLHNKTMMRIRGKENISATELYDYRKEFHEFQTTLNFFDIKIAYGWIGHRGEWFFPTYSDALLQEEYLWHCAE